MIVSRDFLPLFGAPLLLGQPFQPDDYESFGNAVLGPVVPPTGGGVATTIISHRLWHRQFGADPGVVGRSVVVNGLPAIVVGVMDSNIRFDETPTGVADCWIPLVESVVVNQRRLRQFVVIGRIEQGASIDAARSEMGAIAQALAQEHPADNKGWRIRLLPLQESIVANVRTVLVVLLAGVGCVLLIAFANVANLFLIRGVSRSREVAVRVALGAGRSRLIRQWLAESLLLAMAGGGLGLAVAFWAVPMLVLHAPPHLPRASDIVVDRRVFAFCLTVSLTCGILSGLAPAMTSRLRGPAAVLYAAGTAAAPRWLWIRHSLAVAQVGLAILLLIGAGLVVRTSIAVHALDLGFDPSHVLSFGVDLRGERYRGMAALQAFNRELVARLERLPGVESSGAGSVPLLGGMKKRFITDAENQPTDSLLDVVSPGYFQALRFRLVSGRLLSRDDTAGSARVTIVNQAFARAAWGTDRVVGRLVRADATSWMTVVGVVHDVRTTSVEGDPPPVAYIPHDQSADAASTNYVVRTTGDPTLVLPAVKAAVRDLDSTIAVSRVATLEERVSRAVAARDFNSWLFALYSVAALLLAVLGLYALISEVVASRTAEIGVRIALGARRLAVARLVVSRSLVVTGLGLVIGLSIAAAVTRYLEGMLFGLTPLDPLTFSVVPLAFIVAAALAAALPARRAASVDPVVALRCE
jgi:putative ABC transport system permease protein